MDKKECFKNVGEFLNKYAPAAMFGSAIAYSIASWRISIERQKQLTKAYASMRDSFEEYKWKAGTNNYRKMHHTPMRRRWRS